MLEEAEKRDNRKLGKELDLFSTHEEAGPGLIYWHPKGGRFRVELENWWRDEHYKNGYELLFTPHIGKSWLWETSGHLGFYKEGMYPPMEIDGDKYYAKPMNCPFHIMIYKNGVHSYRDLPLRWGELGTVYRYERAGALHGLMRVRGFTQDDAHIICTPEQIEDEIAEVLRFSLFMWKTLGFKEIKAYLATKPPRTARWASRNVGHRAGEPAQGGGQGRPGLRDGRGRRRLLRPQDRPEGKGRHRPRVADDHHTVRLQRARALRHDLRGRRRPEEAALHGAPRPA
jgi:threonyl-tRNA synthetase